MEESCSKCIPCRVGTRQMHGLLTKICKGQGAMCDLELLEELAPRSRRQACAAWDNRRRTRFCRRCGTSATSTWPTSKRGAAPRVCARWTRAAPWRHLSGRCSGDAVLATWSVRPRGSSPTEARPRAPDEMAAFAKLGGRRSKVPAARQQPATICRQSLDVEAAARVQVQPTGPTYVRWQPEKLTLRFPLRFPLAFDGKLLGQVVRLFTDSVSSFARIGAGNSEQGQAHDDASNGVAHPTPRHFCVPPYRGYGTSRTAGWLSIITFIEKV